MIAGRRFAPIMKNLSFRESAGRTVLAFVAIMVGLFVLQLVLFVAAGFPSRPELAVGMLAITEAAVVAIGAMRIFRYADRTAESVRRMTEATQEIARGDLARTIDTADLPSPELRDLGNAINATATRARADIAEMKRLERVRSEFLGNVSHELRTPIFSVQGYLETLLDGAVDDRNVRDDFLYKAHQNVLRLHTLLTDLIEISRIESGEMKMSFRYFDAADYLRGILQELGPTAEIAKVNLELKVLTAKNGPVEVLGDRDRLKQAIVNLVENAIKYNHPGGTVSVELEPRDGEAVLRVRDTGIGIPEEDTRRIFERFYRVNKDRSRAVGGSGLGLAIVKHIVEAHGSSVQVESRIGSGSCFSFALKM